MEKLRLFLFLLCYNFNIKQKKEWKMNSGVFVNGIISFLVAMIISCSYVILFV